MAKKRPDRDPEPPAHHEEPPAAGQHQKESPTAILPSSLASISLWQLEGLADAIDGMAVLARDGAAALACVDVRPPKVIGKKREALDYHRDRDTGHLVLGGRPVACDQERLVGWEDTFALGGDPLACRNLSGRQIQRDINTAVKNAREAAAALCADPLCSEYKIRLRYQEWHCLHTVDEGGHHSSSLIVSIQLAVTCVERSGEQQ